MIPAGINGWKDRLRNAPGMVSLSIIFKYLLYPSYRSVHRLRRSSPDNLFQPYATTCFNRYPVLFNYILDRLSNDAAPKLLSFGCSTGEEAFTLRQYFPRSEIVGIDINPYNIKVCRNRLARINDHNMQFKLAGSTEAEQESTYSAIFCLAVFRHGSLEENNSDYCGDLICFSDFESTLMDLSRCLKPGGYLVIQHSMFRFSDTAIASEFDTVFISEKETLNPSIALFDSDNHRMPESFYGEVVFQKRTKFRDIAAT